MHKRAIVTTAGFATSTHSPVVVVASSGLAITGNENQAKLTTAPSQLTGLHGIQTPESIPSHGTRHMGNENGIRVAANEGVSGERGRERLAISNTPPSLSDGDLHPWKWKLRSCGSVPGVVCVSQALGVGGAEGERARRKSEADSMGWGTSQ
jgi:hypothetical protein